MEILTKVTRSKSFDKQLDRVPGFIKVRVQTWVNAVEYAGLRETMRSPGLHDEPLKGSRWGQRSVRLNRSYRLIYRVLSEGIHIELLEVHKHEY